MENVIEECDAFNGITNGLLVMFVIFVFLINSNLHLNMKNESRVSVYTLNNVSLQHLESFNNPEKRKYSWYR